MKREESRRRPRLQTRQHASARVMGMRFGCEVHNFCRSGLYLAFVDGAMERPAERGWTPGALVEVQFSVAAEGVERPFRFFGTVAHATPAGAGLMAPSMPQEAFDALQAAAQRRPATAPPAADGSDPPQLRQQCLQLFKTCIRQVLDEFFQDLNAPFQQAADKTLAMLEKQRLRDAPAALQAARGTIERRMLARAGQGLAQNPQGRAGGQPGEAGKSLALLGESEFEDWLRLTAVINQIESEGEFSEPMARVERRYGRLVGQPLDRQNNPFGATAICRAFQAATQELPLCADSKAVMYQAFGLALGRHLAGLVQRLDEVLATMGDPAPERKAPAPKPAPAAPAPKESPVAVQGPARPAAPAAALPGRQLFALAQDLMHAAAQQRGRPAGAPAAAAAPARPAGAVASLADLGRVIEAAPAAGWVGAPNAGRRPLSERMALAAGGLNIGAPMRQALDSAGSLLAKALTASSGGQGIDSLLKRLEQPLLKLSLHEQGFPAQADHPARQVVDLLEQYAVAVDDEGRFLDPKLHGFLQLAVDRICRQADLDPGVYLKARDSLARLLPPLQQSRQVRVEQLQEGCESQHRTRLARRRVQQALQRRLAGREVPKVVLALLQAGWRQALVMLELRLGEQHGRWTEALALLDRVLWLLSPESVSTPSSRKRAALAASAQLDSVLSSVNPLPGEREAVLAELQRALRTIGEGQPLPAAMADASLLDLAAQAEEDEANEALAALAQRLRVGSWWQVWKAGAWVPLQLIWCSDPAADYAFTNRSATRKLEISLAKLAQRLREGSVREGSDQAQPLLERSVQALLDEAQGQMLQKAHRDPLTGLLSRKGFLQRLGQTALQQHADHTHLLGIIEFDQFRVVYQACGVAQAEALARTLAERAKACLGPDAVLASFRDDTIALLLPACRRDEGLARLERVLGHLGEFRHQTEGHSFSIGANMGVAEFRPGLDSADVALQQADMACVAAKSLGRNRMHCYAADDRQLRNQQDLLAWAGRIDSLLAGNGLFLRGQMVMPIAAQTSLKAYHEVLLGVELAPGQQVGPQPFILAVEAQRRAHEVDLWVLRQTFNWIRQHRAEFASGGGFSINLSATSLAHAGVIEALRRELLAGDLPTELITFEITETAAIESYAAAADFIRQMRRYGCRFALDDFGSGHTSYAHLKNLQADALKIDGSFVKDIVDNPADFAIVKSMNDIAHSLGMRTVAEYVESPAILAKLREIGVDYAQGYAIHKPCRLDQLLAREAA